MPQIALSMVDFPAPLPPTMAKRLPSGTTALTPRSTSGLFFSYRNQTSFNTRAEGRSSQATGASGSAVTSGGVWKAPKSQFRPSRTVRGHTPFPWAP